MITNFNISLKYFLENLKIWKVQNRNSNIKYHLEILKNLKINIRLLLLFEVVEEKLQGICT